MATAGRPAALEPALRRFIGSGLERDGGGMLAAAAAIASCAVAARRTSDGGARRAWTLISLSAGAVFAGALFAGGS